METPVLGSGNLNVRDILENGNFRMGYKIFAKGENGDYTNHRRTTKYTPHKWHEVIGVDTSPKECSYGLNLFYTVKDCLKFFKYHISVEVEIWEFVVPIDGNVISEPTGNTEKFRVKFAFMHRNLSDDEIFTRENLYDDDISHLCQDSPKFANLVRDGIIDIDLTNRHKCLLLTYQGYYDKSLDFTSLSEYEIVGLCWNSSIFAELLRDGLIDMDFTNDLKYSMLLWQDYFVESLDFTGVSGVEINELCQDSLKFAELLRDGMINIDLNNYQKCLLLEYQNYYDESLDFTSLSENEVADLCKYSPKFAELLRAGLINIDLTNHQKCQLLAYQNYYDDSIDFTCLETLQITSLCRESPKFAELLRDGVIDIDLTNHQKWLLLVYQNYYDESLDFTCLITAQITSLCRESPKFAELLRDGMINIDLTNHQKWLLLAYHNYYDESLDFDILPISEIIKLYEYSPKFMELIHEGNIKSPAINALKFLNGMCRFEDMNWETVNESYLLEEYMHIHN